MIDSIPRVSGNESRFLQGTVFSITALFIALCRPYKKTYMNILDTLSLLHLAAICHIMSSNSFANYLVFIQMLILFPFVIFIVLLTIRLICRTRQLRITWSPVQILTHLKVRRTDVDVTPQQQQQQQQQQLISPTATYRTIH